MKTQLKKVLQVLFPKPRWYRECEAALEADRMARQKIYDDWDRFFKVG